MSVNNSTAMSRRLTLAGLVLACAFLNVVSNWLSERVLELPFFMDTAFTIAASLGMGLWPGLVVALLTNVGQEVLNGLPGTNLPFALCGMATAFLARLLARRREGGLFFLDMAGTIILVTLANAFIGGAIALFLFHGTTDVRFDGFVEGLVAVGHSYGSAAFWARIPVNLVDKAIAVVAGCIAASVLPRSPKPAAA